MRGRITTLAVGMAAGAALLSVLDGNLPVLAQNGAGQRFAAVASEKGGQDVFGAYEVDASWPKDLSTIPGHEGWTFGAGHCSAGSRHPCSDHRARAACRFLGAPFRRDSGGEGRDRLL